MNTKPLFGIAAALVSGTACANNLLDYQLTVGSNDSLTDLYVIEYDATSSFVSVAPVNTEDPSAVFPAGTVLNGIFNAGNTPSTDTIFLNVVGAFTDTTGTNVALSFPQALGDSLITGGSTWADVNTLYFHGSLPTEASALTDLQSGIASDVYNIADAYDYMPASSPVLQPVDAAGTIVDFDGAVNGGKFSYQPVPEPASLAALGLGALALVRRRRRA